MGINIKKIRPMNVCIVTTKEEYEEDTGKGGLITKTAGTLKEYQRVVAVGPMVRGIKEGDLVAINPKRYARYKHEKGSLKDGVITDNPVLSYNFNVIELDHVPHLLLIDQDSDFVIEDYEEEPDTPAKTSPIIVPPAPKIIV